MIITNCPRCGALNATTTCNKCGWSQFNKSTVSTGARVVEWEEEMSKRAEMECKRCGDNEDRIDGFCSNECKDKYSLEEALSKMSIRIAELEAAQRWVPLEDPPKFDGRYLLRNIYGDVYSSKYVVKTETWVVHDFAMFTHWMPLPELPKVQQ